MPGQPFQSGGQLTEIEMQTNKQQLKVCLRQGSKVETTKHTGVKTTFPIHRTKETTYRLLVATTPADVDH
jgi:hypothetical protein